MGNQGAREALSRWRTHSAEFKARVSMEAINGNETIYGRPAAQASRSIQMSFARCRGQLCMIEENSYV